MIQAFVTRTRDLLDRQGPTSNEAVSGEAASNEAASNRRESAVTTTVYRCQECDRTFVSEEKETCSQCGVAVTAGPNEYDLGIY